MSADVPDAKHDAEYWLRLHAETRAIASIMTDPELRRFMLSISAAYLVLARRVEVRESKKNDDDTRS